jgi:transcriptional regulator with XRE-family HTH domain
MINQALIQEFGQRIRNLRLAQELSQEELSFATGFHRTYIGMIEWGERNISLSHIDVFAKAFKMTVSDLLNLKDVNPKHSFRAYETKSEK